MVPDSHGAFQRKSRQGLKVAVGSTRIMTRHHLGAALAHTGLVVSSRAQSLDLTEVAMWSVR